MRLIWAVDAMCDNGAQMNEDGLRRNVRLYGWYKVFNKRVFLPVTAIYLVEVGNVSLGGIGVIATVTALVTLLMQAPGGYLADRYTRRLTMITGSGLLAAGVAVLAVAPSLAGGLLSGTLAGIGFALMHGSGQALMHDSLEQCGKGNQYVKVMGRAQSKGLIGNVVLIALIPMTYSIDKRMPFVLGVVAFLILLAISYSFVEPKRESDHGDGSHGREIVTAFRIFVRKHTLLLFATLGLVFGLYAAPTDFTNLILTDLGLSPQFIGWAFAVSSLLAAAGGLGLHYLQALSFRSFIFLDILICCGFFVLVGVTQSLAISVAAFLVNLGFWRLRGILYQHYLLKMFKGAGKKAMLMSLLGMGEQLFAVILPLIIALCITQLGYYSGYLIIGIVTGVLLCGLTVMSFVSLRRAPLYNKNIL